MNKIIITIFMLIIKNSPAKNTNETPTKYVQFTATDRDDNLFFNLPEFLEAYEVNMYRIQYTIAIKIDSRFSILNNNGIDKITI